MKHPDTNPHPKRDSDSTDRIIRIAAEWFLDDDKWAEHNPGLSWRHHPMFDPVDHRSRISDACTRALEANHVTLAHGLDVKRDPVRFRYSEAEEKALTIMFHDLLHPTSHPHHQVTGLHGAMTADAIDELLSVHTELKRDLQDITLLSIYLETIGKNYSNLTDGQPHDLRHLYMRRRQLEQDAESSTYRGDNAKEILAATARITELVDALSETVNQALEKPVLVRNNVVTLSAFRGR